MQIDCHRDEDKREVVVELELLATNDSETDNGASSKDGKIETKSVDGAADEIAGGEMPTCAPPSRRRWGARS